MKRRLFGLTLLAVMTAVLLTGCGNDPDALYKKGKYAEAYPEFVKRAGTNEAALRNETVNGSVDSRNKSGNQAIHDLYYAADCQKKLGNNAKARVLYRRVVELSRYQIRVPHNKGIDVKNSFDRMVNSLRDMRSQELDYARRYEEWRNQPPSSGNTDPYSGGGSNTDPYSGGSSTDPYSGGSSTDPYSGGTRRTTDPYSSSSNTAPRIERPSDGWLSSSHNTMRSNQRDFERLLYGCTTADCPKIEELKREYRLFAASLDNYAMVAAPGGILYSPGSLASQIAYQSLQINLDRFRRALYEGQFNTTYTTHPITLKEPHLVAQAEAALRAMGDDPSTIGRSAPQAAGTAAPTPSVTIPSVNTTANDTTIQVAPTGTTPFGQ
jgi:hypothetical protein